MNEAEKISELIKTLSLKQKDFAFEVGLSKGAISGILSGKQGLSGILKRAIQLRYNVNPAWWSDDSAPMFLDNREPEITLSDDERALVMKLRSLPKKERERALAVLKASIGD